MSERHTPIIAFAVASAPVIFGILVAVLTTIPALFFPIIGVFIGAAVIRSVVLWINSQSDPRLAKRPPDSP